VITIFPMPVLLWLIAAGSGVAPELTVGQAPGRRETGRGPAAQFGSQAVSNGGVTGTRTVR